MDSIKTLAANVMTAANLDSLKGALEDLQDALDEQFEETGDYDRSCLSDHVDLTSLPTWGEEPADTRDVFSYDAQRLLYIEGSAVVIEDRKDLDDDSEGEDEGEDDSEDDDSLLEEHAYRCWLGY